MHAETINFALMETILQFIIIRAVVSPRAVVYAVSFFISVYKKSVSKFVFMIFIDNIGAVIFYAQINARIYINGVVVQEIIKTRDNTFRLRTRQRLTRSYRVILHI